MRAAIQSLEVVWAYVIEGLVIPVFDEGEAPRHLVLTGPNGSGKSSILRGLATALVEWPDDKLTSAQHMVEALEANSNKRQTTPSAPNSCAASTPTVKRWPTFA